MPPFLAGTCFLGYIQLPINIDCRIALLRNTLAFLPPSSPILHSTRSTATSQPLSLISRKLFNLPLTLSYPIRLLQNLRSCLSSNIFTLDIDVPIYYFFYPETYPSPRSPKNLSSLPISGSTLHLIALSLESLITFALSTCLIYTPPYPFRQHPDSRTSLFQGKLEMHRSSFDHASMHIPRRVAQDS